MSYRLKAVAALLLLTGSASAEEWKTSDGYISVAVPDLTRFVREPTGPWAAESVDWKLPDDSMRMLVIELPIPPDVRLVKKELERGFLAEVNRYFKNGKLLDSIAEQRGRHEVLTMTARADDDDGTSVYFTQTAVAANDKVYKVMVCGVGKDTRTDPDAVAFISSFKILERVTTENPVPQPDRWKTPEEQNAYSAGRIAGMITIGVLILVGAVWVVYRMTRKPHEEPPSRRKRLYEDF